MTPVLVLFVLVVAVNCCFMAYFITDVTAHYERAEREPGSTLGLGVFSFFQFLLSSFGISNFAIGAAVYSKLNLVSTKKLPGTLNAAAVIPVTIMALVYITSIEVDVVTLAVPIAAQTAGAHISPRFVVEMPRRSIRIFLALGMLVVVLHTAADTLGFSPAGGNLTALDADRLALLGGLCFLYGILNNLGLGSFAPTMATVYALGLNPEVAFPIMMGAAAFSVPVGSIQFIKHECYSRKITVISAVCGTLGVLAAAFAFDNIDLSLVKWIIAGVLLYSAGSLLFAALKDQDDIAAFKIEKKERGLSIVGRLTGFCLALILICAVSLIGIFVKNFHSISSDYAEINIGEHNVRLRDSVRAYLRGHEGLLLSARAGVAHFMSKEPVDLEGLRLYLEKTSLVLEDVSTLYCTTNEVWNQPGGYAVFSQPWDTPPDWNNTKRPWFVAAKNAGENVAYSKPYIDALTGDIILDISANVFDENGKDIGVVSEAITIESLSAMLRQTASLEGQEAFLIDADGGFVVHPDKMTAVQRDFFRETGLERYRNDILSSGVFSASDRDMAVYSSSIPATGWFVISIIPMDKIVSSTNDRLISLFLTTLLIILFMLMVVLISLLIIIRGENRGRLKAERLTRGKDAFIASVNHEIRTPMNAVIGLSELAQMEYGAPKGLQYISSIKSAGVSLLAIINDLLDFSTIESGRLELVEAPYETASLLNDVLVIIRIQTAEKPLELIVDVDPGIPGNIIGDADRLRQILLNLLGAAVKHGQTGTISFSVSGKKLTENTVRLTFKVTDSGLGLKPGDIPRLFDESTGLDEKSDNAIEGLGLRLSIARSLCRAMEGDITSEYDRGGSVFVATLLQAVTDWTPMGEAASATPIGRQRITFIAPAAQVLVAEDVSVSLQVTEGMLAPYRMRVSTCMSGREAVELVQKHYFDLVLMDHLMPGMDGLETVQAIRALGGRFTELPIVVLTTNAVYGMKEMFLRGGFNDFLSMPVEMAKLDALLQKWVPAVKQSSIIAKKPLRRSGNP